MSEQQETSTIINEKSNLIDENIQKSQGDKIANTQLEQQSQQNHSDAKSQVSEQEIPQHFYDSDMASVCEKDFMSDNEPPKDIVQERKLLYKEKLLHVFKTIIRVGVGIDKPARYDEIRLKFKEVSQQEIKKYAKHAGKQEINHQHEHQNTESGVKKLGQTEQHNNENPTTQNKLQQKQKLTLQQTHSISNQQANLPPYYSTSYLDNSPQTHYNIGNQHQEIQRLVTSMKRGETGLFELQHLVVSKKTNIKIKSKTEIIVIHVDDWTTVIDLDGDKRLLKYVLRKGEGAFRVALYDKISFRYQIARNNIVAREKQFLRQKLQKEFIEEKLPCAVWRVLTSMKDQESVRLEVSDGDFRDIQGEEFYNQLQDEYKQKCLQLHGNKGQQENNQPILPQSSTWTITLQIFKLVKIDDIHLDGRILKQTLTRGVSTAKPESSSLIYYALKFIDLQENELKKDECFDSDWWEDYGKLDELKGIRKNYLDDYAVSKMLRKTIKRMKPAEIALVELRDKQLFTYGQDFEEMKELLHFTNETIPQTIKIIIRVYNFTEAKTAFSMDIEEKIIESKRKKQIAIKLLSQGKIEKALKRFQNIVAFYSSQKINQQAYDEKVSALMNAILCYMKLQKYQEMIPLCNQILLKPRHGHQSKDTKIIGPGHAKVQGSLKTGELQEDEQAPGNDGDTRRIASDLVQNQKILDKCLYRKAFAFYQMGECAETLKSLDQISEGMRSTDQVKKLYKDATTGKQKYEQKSKKIFKSMFG